MAKPCPVYFMDSQVYFERLNQNPLPVVVDLWAPWCGPCKMIKPILEKLAKEYEGRMDLWQINADNNQDLLRELKVYGIPTLIVYHNGKETLRQVGAKPARALQSIFETLATGGVPTPVGISTADRFVRLTAGLALSSFGWLNNTNWILLILGGALMFSAVYDRCPIWRALTNQLKKMTNRA